MPRKFEVSVSNTGWLCAKVSDEYGVWSPVVQLTRAQCREIKQFLGPASDDPVTRRPSMH